MTDDAGDASMTQTLHAAFRFLRVLRYHKAYIITSLLVAALLGGLYYLTATRIYEASASLLVTQNGTEVLQTGTSSSGSADAVIPTYERLFSSAVVLDGAIARLQQRPAEARIDLADQPAENHKTILRSNLSASAIRRTNIIELTYHSKSPSAAEAVVAAIVDAYMEFMEKNHQKLSVEIANILRTELNEKEQELQKKQKELLDLKRQAGVVVREGNQFVHPIVERAMKINETLIEVRKERLRLEASLAAIRAAVHKGGDLRQHLITVEPMVGRELIMSGMGLNPEYTRITGEIEKKLIDDSARLESIAAHYGPTHPQVQELQRGIENARRYLAQYQGNVNGRLEEMHSQRLGPMLTAMVEEKLGEMWSQENQLLREYQVAEGEAIQLNDRVVALQFVENEVQRLQHWHDTLLDQIAGIDLQQEAGSVRVAIVSEPTAEQRPVSPRLSMIALLCLAGGLSVGTALVYVRDLMDDRFRSPEELQHQTRVPVLAIIRSLPPLTGDGPPVHVSQSPDAVETEGFRTLRTTLAFSGDELQRVAVTSPEPGDGKTTVLSNLAGSYAMGGKRTLMIDCDLRRPGLSKLFQVRGLNGVSDVLRSEEELDAICRRVIRPTGVERLDLLPCGPKPRDPAELLSSDRFAELIAWAETNYDQVLIDCPPVMAASDAAIVGRSVDGIMLVVQPEKNHRRLVLRAVEHLASLRANLIGVIANRISDAKEGYYDYGYGYGYGYGTHYGEDEVDDSTQAAPVDPHQTTIKSPTSIPSQSPHTSPTHDSEPRHRPRRAA